MAFSSYASNLVAGDTNGAADVFVHDRVTGQTSRVSVASDGTEGDDESWAPSISADGRFVAFAANSNNLIARDTNGRRDVYLHDATTGETSLISVSTNGEQGNAHSESVGGVSADGKYVTFGSEASNLVPDDTNSCPDVFVRFITQNNAPTTPTTVAVRPAMPGPESLWCNASGSTDPDGDPVTYEYWWSCSTDDGTTWGEWGLPGRSLGGWRVHMGEMWRARARASDLSAVSPWKVGSPVTIVSMLAAVTPPDGTTGVAQRPNLVLTFRWPVNQASAESHFRLMRGDTNLAGTFTWPQANRKMKFVPASKLMPGTVHTMSVLSGIDCTSGRKLDWSETACTFTSAGDAPAEPTAPTAVTITPGAPGPEDLYGHATGGTDPAGYPLHYEYSWAHRKPGSTEWSDYHHLGPQVTQTSWDYTVEIGDRWRVRARASNGSTFSAWTYSDTVTILSMVAATTPLDGATGVPVRPNIYVTFRWPVDQASAASRVRLLQYVGASGENVPGTITWPQANRKLKFVPDRALWRTWGYFIRINPGITLTSGRVLNWREEPCTFRVEGYTAPAATVAATQTASGVSITLNLSAAATVHTVVTNIAGRAVAELPERALPEGMSSLLWNGKSSAGTRVPPGRYLVRVEASGGDGARAVALTVLQLR